MPVECFVDFVQTVDLFAVADIVAAADVALILFQNNIQLISSQKCQLFYIAFTPLL